MHAKTESQPADEGGPLQYLSAINCWAAEHHMQPLSAVLLCTCTVSSCTLNTIIAREGLSPPPLPLISILAAEHLSQPQLHNHSCYFLLSLQFQ